MLHGQALMSERCEIPLVNATSQEGLADNAAAAKARAAGLRV